MFLHKLKFWWQRQTRGFSDDELWSLDITIAKFILPRLEAFKNCCTTDMEEHVEDILWSFRFVLSDDYVPVVSNENWKKFQKGMNRFAKYYLGLWF
jgi:hypothetical protein